MDKDELRKMLRQALEKQQAKEPFSSHPAHYDEKTVKKLIAERRKEREKRWK